MKNFKLTFLTMLFISQTIGCSLLPQTYDSPIPVYVDLGSSKAMTTTLPNTTPKQPSKTTH